MQTEDKQEKELNCRGDPGGMQGWVDLGGGYIIYQDKFTCQRLSGAIQQSA